MLSDVILCYIILQCSIAYYVTLCYISVCHIAWLILLCLWLSSCASRRRGRIPICTLRCVFCCVRSLFWATLCVSMYIYVYIYIYIYNNHNNNDNDNNDNNDNCYYNSNISLSLYIYIYNDLTNIPVPHGAAAAVAPSAIQADGGALYALKFRCTQRDSLSEAFLWEKMPCYQCKGKSLRDSEKLWEALLRALRTWKRQARRTVEPECCYALLCFAMLCYAMLCYAMLCYAMISYMNMIQRAILWYNVLYYDIVFYTQADSGAERCSRLFFLSVPPTVFGQAAAEELVLSLWLFSLLLVVVVSLRWIMIMIVILLVLVIILLLRVTS